MVPQNPRGMVLLGRRKRTLVFLVLSCDCIFSWLLFLCLCLRVSQLSFSTSCYNHMLLLFYTATSRNGTRPSRLPDSSFWGLSRLAYPQHGWSRGEHTWFLGMSTLSPQLMYIPLQPCMCVFFALCDQDTPTLVLPKTRYILVSGRVWSRSVSRRCAFV